MSYEVRSEIVKCVRGVFPAKTKTSEILEIIIESSMIAQLNTMKHFFVAFELTFSAFLKSYHMLPIRVIVREALSNNRREQLRDEYKKLWHAAEKIQTHWRIAISNPEHSLCRKRLRIEYESLVP